MGLHWQRLAGWLEDEMSTPLEGYRDPIQMLAQRAAASALLSENVAQYAVALDLLAERAHLVVDHADLAATGLIVSKPVEEMGKRCLSLYTPGSSTDDEAALGVALLMRNPELAQAAQSHRISLQIERPTAFSAELLFLADEVRRGTPGDALLFSAVRGIHHSILTGVKRTVAPFVCAFGAAIGDDVYGHLQGALRRYDELSFAGEKAPFRLHPKRLELPAGEERIRLFVVATGSGFRLDVISAPALIDELPATFELLRRSLADAERRRFDKIRKSVNTELEIVISDASVECADVFSRRISAALTLMRSSGYAIGSVIVNKQAEKH